MDDWWGPSAQGRQKPANYLVKRPDEGQIEKFRTRRG
jgi:hypothetical protein